MLSILPAAFATWGDHNVALTARRHGHVIPELLRVSQADPGGQLIPDTGELAVHQDPEDWPGCGGAPGRRAATWGAKRREPDHSCGRPASVPPRARASDSRIARSL